MEIGVYHEFHCRPDQSSAEAFEVALAQVEAADRWGLDAIWLAEIHQQARRSVLTAPLTVASAIAARTRHIKIGTGVQVLPLCHPLRLAEETATIDQISKGRLLFGVGRSGNPRSYVAYGVPYSDVGAVQPEADSLHAGLGGGRAAERSILDGDDRSNGSRPRSSSPGRPAGVTDPRGLWADHAVPRRSRNALSSAS